MSKKYRVVCDKERHFLNQGCTIELVYGELPYLNLSKDDAEDVARQLNDLAVDGETYSVVEEK